MNAVYYSDDDWSDYLQDCETQAMKFQAEQNVERDNRLGKSNAEFVRKVEAMPPEERVAFMVEAGSHTPDGKLTERFKDDLPSK